MNIMVYGSIFQGLRSISKKWGESDLLFHNIGNFISDILTCPMCFGLWGGIFLSLTIYSPIYNTFHTSYYISWFFDGILSSGAVWALNAIIEYFESFKK